MRKARLLLLVLVLGLCQCKSGGSGGGPPIWLEAVDLVRIWDQATHNAFTDLIRFQDRFYCVFRESSGHDWDDGRVRVLSSEDGVNWETRALFEIEVPGLEPKIYDLRDPKLSITADQRLLVLGVAALREGTQDATEHYPFVASSTDGVTWTAPTLTGDLGKWIWRLDWFGGTGYGVAYNTGTGPDPSGTTLYQTTDGLNFTQLVPDLYDEGMPTEATLRFDPLGTAYCLQRRDGSPNTAVLGVSSAPYTDWTWNDLGVFYGGPDFMRIPSGHWIGAGRLRENGAQTVLTLIDVGQATIQSLLGLPSGSDTSYPGMVWHDGLLWISYYSDHEGKSSIYIARVRVHTR